MDTALHPWRTVHPRTGRRFAIGLAIALSFSLVAFEWQTRAPHVGPETWWDDGDDFVTEILPPVVIERTVAAAAPAPKRRWGAVVPVPDGGTEPTETPTETPTSEPDGLAGAVTEGPDPAPTNSSATRAGPMPWGLMTGMRPHFRECLLSDPEHVDACTEERIGRHLERHFKVPRSVRGQVRTTITFEIDTLGRVGLLVCTPKVDKAVEAEVERVIRGLPPFEPGRQGPQTVPVYYQVPLRIRTR